MRTSLVFPSESRFQMLVSSTKIRRLRIFCISSEDRLRLILMEKSNGAADKPRRAGKPQAFPPGVGLIRWLCGASRRATSGCLSAAPLSRARSVRDNVRVQRRALARPLERLVRRSELKMIQPCQPIRSYSHNQPLWILGKHQFHFDSLILGMCHMPI